MKSLTNWKANRVASYRSLAGCILTLGIAHVAAANPWYTTSANGSGNSNSTQSGDAEGSGQGSGSGASSSSAQASSIVIGLSSGTDSYSQGSTTINTAATVNASAAFSPSWWLDGTYSSVTLTMTCIASGSVVAGTGIDQNDSGHAELSGLPVPASDVFSGLNLPGDLSAQAPSDPYPGGAASTTPPTSTYIDYYYNWPGDDPTVSPTGEANPPPPAVLTQTDNFIRTRDVFTSIPGNRWLTEDSMIGVEEKVYTYPAEYFEPIYSTPYFSSDSVGVDGGFGICLQLSNNGVGYSSGSGMVMATASVSIGN